jgi:hypothetical protein
VRYRCDQNLPLRNVGSRLLVPALCRTGHPLLSETSKSLHRRLSLCSLPVPKQTDGASGVASLAESVICGTRQPAHRTVCRSTSPSNPRSSPGHSRPCRSPLRSKPRLHTVKGAFHSLRCDRREAQCRHLRSNCETGGRRRRGSSSCHWMSGSLSTTVPAPVSVTVEPAIVAGPLATV